MQKLRKKKKLLLKNKKKKSRRRIRKSFKNKKTLLNKKFLHFYKIQRFLNINKIINIKVNQNNIFCSLFNNRKKKILKLVTSGTEKLKTSKKKLKFNSKIIFKSFFKKIRNKMQNKKSTILVNISSPLRIRKFLLQLLSRKIKSKIALNVNHKKCFNGCKVSKKRRKKQRRIFKVFK